jgi:hypothetical protein
VTYSVGWTVEERGSIPGENMRVSFSAKRSAGAHPTSNLMASFSDGKATRA